jgi:hypothetical protein
VIESAWTKVWNLTDAEERKTNEELGQEQPCVWLALQIPDSRDTRFSREEAVLLYLTVLAVWDCFRRSGQSPARVTPEDLLGAIEANEKMNAYFESEPEADLDRSVQDMLEGYNQRTMLEFFVLRLMLLQRMGCVVQEKNLQPLVLNVKAFIDCFDRAGPRANPPPPLECKHICRSCPARKKPG